MIVCFGFVPSVSHSSASLVDFCELLEHLLESCLTLFTHCWTYHSLPILMSYCFEWSIENLLPSMCLYSLVHFLNFLSLYFMSPSRWRHKFPWEVMLIGLVNYDVYVSKCHFFILTWDRKQCSQTASAEISTLSFPASVICNKHYPPFFVIGGAGD